MMKYGITYFNPGASTPSGGKVFFEKDDGRFLAECREEAERRYEAIRAHRGVRPEEIGGNCYFISPDGNDEADGKTPEHAWRSCERLMREYDLLKEGDGVFFARGGEWNCAEPGKGQHTNHSGRFCFMLKAGVHYGAYGEGEKPVFTNSILASGEEMWKETEWKDIWKLSVRVGGDIDDVGTIVFDPDPKTGRAKAWGVKMVPSVRFDPFCGRGTTEDCGIVSNGMTSYHCAARTLTSPADISGELEFLHDHANGDFYLHCGAGNPGKVFGEIRILRCGHVIRGDMRSGDRNTTVEDLCVRYGGAHGIQVYDSKNVAIRFCEVGWIGGSKQSDALGGCIRYGNGIENWGGCDGFFVHDNYIYQCYDTAITSQFGGKVRSVMREAHFEHNLLSYINTCFELWNGSDTEYQLYDSSIRDNLMFCSGYGFGVIRPAGNKNGAFILGDKVNDTKDRYTFVFENNTGVYSTHHCIGEGLPKVPGRENGVVFRKNRYLMSRDTGTIMRCRDDIPGNSGGCKCRYRYDRETAEYLLSLGIEKDTEFYYYDGHLFPEEETGAFLV